MSSPVTLRSTDLEVVVLPAKGADIVAILDRATGIDVLFTTPWQRRTLPGFAPGADSEAAWLASYTGGWQVLIPNAGPAREHDGVTQGYHGEAALLGWPVLSQSDRHVELEVDLLTAPLHLHRTVTVDGPSVTLDERVVNTSPDPVAFRWVHHPAFGTPFIDGDAYWETDARTVVTDSDSPGALLPPNMLTSFPVTADSSGDRVDLSRLPPPEHGRAIFAALTDFGDGAARIVSPNAGFAMTLAWDTTVFPYAWFWQECHATRGFPWFRRAYVAAVEPANVLPGEGTVGPLRRGVTTPLPGHGEITTQLRMTRGPISS